MTSESHNPRSEVHNPPSESHDREVVEAVRDVVNSTNFGLECLRGMTLCFDVHAMLILATLRTDGYEVVESDYLANLKAERHTIESEELKDRRWELVHLRARVAELESERADLQLRVKAHEKGAAEAARRNYYRGYDQGRLDESGGGDADDGNTSGPDDGDDSTVAAPSPSPSPSPPPPPEDLDDEPEPEEGANHELIDWRAASRSAHLRAERDALRERVADLKAERDVARDGERAWRTRAESWASQSRSDGEDAGDREVKSNCPHLAGDPCQECHPQGLPPSAEDWEPTDEAVERAWPDDRTLRHIEDTWGASGYEAVMHFVATDPPPDANKVATRVAAEYRRERDALRDGNDALRERVAELQQWAEAMQGFVQSILELNSQLLEGIHGGEAEEARIEHLTAEQPGDVVIAPRWATRTAALIDRLRGLIDELEAENERLRAERDRIVVWATKYNHPIDELLSGGGDADDREASDPWVYEGGGGIGDLPEDTPSPPPSSENWEHTQPERLAEEVSHGGLQPPSSEPLTEFKEALGGDVVVEGVASPGALNASEILATRGWFTQNRATGWEPTDEAVERARGVEGGWALSADTWRAGLKAAGPPPERSWVAMENWLIESGAKRVALRERVAELEGLVQLATRSEPDGAILGPTGTPPSHFWRITTNQPRVTPEQADLIRDVCGEGES